MAGVLIEIDLVLTKQSLARLATELDSAFSKIGTGLAASATPAAQQYTEKLLTTISQQFGQRRAAADGKALSLCRSCKKLI